MVKGWRQLTRIVNDELEKFTSNNTLTCNHLEAGEKPKKQKNKNKTEQTIYV